MCFWQSYICSNKLDVQTREHVLSSAAWLVLSGASAGGFALSFVFLQ